MEILKYKKIGRDKYNLYLDNDEVISLYEDVILRNNLLITKRIDEDNYDIIMHDNDREKAYLMAIKYITFKLRTKKEVMMKLDKDFSSDISGLIIDKLEKNNYLNDDLYAKLYINDRMNISSDGTYRIKKDLLNKGIDEKIIDKYLIKIDDEDIKIKMRRLIDKKIKINNKYTGSVLRNRIYNYLVNLGYDTHEVINVLNEYKFDNSNLNNAYNKLLKQYSKKYDEDKLHYVIFNKLKLMGYSNADILEIMEGYNEARDDT